jgi:integrase
MDDFQKIQSFVMYCLVCGRWICPRRSQDWIRFKIRNFDTDVDNWLDKKVFVFNQFKTSKHTGQQRVDCPPELYRILRKWIRFNKLDYLFVNVKLEPLTSVSYGQKLCSIWGAPPGKTNGYGTNQFRHIYLTNKYANTLDLQDDMKNMGSSIDCAKYYIKKINGGMRSDA